MTERCRYVGPNEPRQLPDGQPCGERHCTVCGYRHLDAEPLTCPTCVGQVRSDLAAIVRLSSPVRLVTEAAHRGVDSEAAMLAGPAADPEAWEHVEASVLCGRLPRGWQERADHERHPYAVLGRLDMIVRDHLDQVTDEPVSVVSAAAYLDKHLSMLAQDPLFDFPDAATEIGRCLAHVEDVLRDGVRAEHSQVPCLDCQRRLELRHGATVAEDRHVCPGCRRTYDDGEYARAKADWLGSEGAERYVLLSDAVRAIERPEFTVRTWIRRGLVQTARHERTRRLMVWWPDVRLRHREAELRSRQAAR